MAGPTVVISSPGRQTLRLIIDAALDIGREGDGLLVADDRVSRRHARLEPGDDGTLIITDLDSANGVLVDGRRIETRVILETGQTAILGDTRIQVLAAGRSGGSSTATEIGRTEAGPTSIERVAEAVTGGIEPGVIGVSDEPGTLTIAFSDIESSTERALDVGDTRWMKILNHHNALVAAHVKAHKGRIVKNQGDGFMMCFRSARQGLLASIGLQRDLTKMEESDAENAVSVRIGLHTGEVLQDDDGDLFGRHVVVAARIGALADGRQILVSNLLKQIAEPRGDLLFGEATEVTLKGVDGLQLVHLVDWESSPID